MSAELEGAPSPDAPMIAWAAWAAEAGCFVFPIGRLGSAEPRYPKWGSQSSNDPARIAGWRATGMPGEGYGIATGQSGLLVADLDVKGGIDGITAWDEIGGPRSPFMVRTPSGGEHHYFRADADIATFTDQSAVAPGVDIRALGGMVVGPGSVRLDGGRYVLDF